MGHVSSENDLLRSRLLKTLVEVCSSEPALQILVSERDSSPHRITHVEGACLTMICSPARGLTSPMKS
jgi:hypothetical protein